MNVPARGDTFLDREGYRNQLGCPISVCHGLKRHHHVNRPKFYTSNREHDDERRGCSMLFVFSLHVQTQPFLWSYVVIPSHFSEAMVTPIVQLCDIEDVILLESGPKNGYRRCDTV